MWVTLNIIFKVAPSFAYLTMMKDGGWHPRRNPWLIFQEWMKADGSWSIASIVVRPASSSCIILFTPSGVTHNQVSLGLCLIYRYHEFRMEQPRILKKKKNNNNNFGLRKGPEWIECLFVEHPRPCLTAMALDVKLLRPLQDLDIIFSNQKSIHVVGCMYEPCVGLLVGGGGGQL